MTATANSKPNAFRVERSTSIEAPPERIFALINDFRRWVSWSPYEKMDPGMKRAYSGAPNGKGAAYAWEGNRKVGVGRMEITDTTSSEITIKLDFFKPFQAQNVAEFTLEPKGDRTTVTWAMHGQNSCNSFPTQPSPFSYNNQRVGAPHRKPPRPPGRPPTAQPGARGNGPSPSPPVEGKRPAPLQLGQVSLQPVSATGPAAFSPGTTVRTVNMLSGSPVASWASPANTVLISWWSPARY